MPDDGRRPAAPRPPMPGVGAFDREAPSEYTRKWQIVSPKVGESCRWESIDGRWVTLTVGRGEALGTVVIAHSGGASEVNDSYEGGLTRAKQLRT